MLFNEEYPVTAYYTTSSTAIFLTQYLLRIALLMRKASAFAPATVANLGVGFDILGLAVREPGDTVIAEWTEVPGVTITAIEGDGGKLSLDPVKNTAGIAAATVLKLAGVTHGVSLVIKKGLPRSSGLGSSAASAVAGAVATNAILDTQLSSADVLTASLEGEALVSGYHADNVAPCLFGGITLIYGLQCDDIVRLPVPAGLHLALVTPAVEVPTASARAVLPASVPLKAMVAQTAGVARLVDALYRGDLEAMAAAMEADGIIEPARAHLMPMLHEVRSAVKAVGALGLVISGAGPTLCAICGDEDGARRAATAMYETYTDAGIECVARQTEVSDKGAYILH